MNWVKPAFNDFLVPSKKRQRNEDFASEEADKLQISNKLTLLSKYFPKSKEELVVNKKKIEEVEYWLENIDSESTYLILSGPPGCGKFRTITILSKSLKIDSVEWITPVAHSYDPEGVNNSLYQSELQFFEDFIVRACRYTSILTPSSKRIVLVKDIPNGYYRNPSAFHSFLENYNKIEKLHVVFILSDVALGRNLFPEQIKLNLCIRTINFNPVTQKNVVTALHNLVRKFDLQKVNPSINSHIEKISEDCNGDLRNAIATLHFVLGDKNGKPFSLPIQKRKRTKGIKSKTKTPSEAVCNTVPDNKIDIFHGLGRVLYAKRENKRLVHNPDEVADSFTTSPQLFVGMLHENYLSTFSSIHDIAKASLSLANSDLLLEDWNANSLLLGCGVSVASHGLMVTNSNPIRKFQQFNKPRLKYDTILGECKDLLESSYPLWKGTDILMDMAPYAVHITNLNFAHSDLIQKLAKF